MFRGESWQGINGMNIFHYFTNIGILMQNLSVLTLNSVKKLPLVDLSTAICPMKIVLIKVTSISKQDCAIVTDCTR